MVSTKEVHLSLMMRFVPQHHPITVIFTVVNGDIRKIIIPFALNLTTARCYLVMLLYHKSQRD